MLHFFGALSRGFCLYFWSFGVIAAGINLSFPLQTTIFKSGPSHEIEITAEQFNFTTKYLPSTETFQPLIIPLTVRSLSDESLNYILSLQISQHYCRDEEAGAVDIPLLGVEVALDGVAFPLFSSGGEGYLVPITDVMKRDHIMRVTYPIILQKDVIQSCYGTFVLMAEVGVI